MNYNERMLPIPAYAAPYPLWETLNMCIKKKKIDMLSLYCKYLRKGQNLSEKQWTVEWFCSETCIVYEVAFIRVYLSCEC